MVNYIEKISLNKNLLSKEEYENIIKIKNGKQTDNKILINNLLDKKENNEKEINNLKEIINNNQKKYLI